MQTAHNRIPIIKLWSILLVTLHGEVNDEFARNMSMDVLARIHREGASGLVIDITGLWILDSHLCSMLAELASAALLMGARTILSGMNPDMAITLETMGVRLGEVATTLDLESALQMLGVRVVADEGDAEAGSATQGEVDTVARDAARQEILEASAERAVRTGRVVMDEPENAENEQLEVAMDGAIEEVLSLLRNVASGDLTGRIAPHFPDTHPAGALALSMNAMIDALAAARTKAETHHRELTDRIAIVDTQRSAIRELSTPIIEVWDRVLCLPIVGMLDSSRATEMTTGLLTSVVAKKAAFAIIDITGIHVMDTGTTDHFLRMARSVRLLGAQCVLSGVNPEVALTVVRMGTEFSPLKSHRNMRDALRYCIRAVSAEREKMRVDRGPRRPQGGKG